MVLEVGDILIGRFPTYYTGGPNSLDWQTEIAQVTQVDSYRFTVAYWTDSCPSKIRKVRQYSVQTFEKLLDAGYFRVADRLTALVLIGNKSK